MSDVLVRDLRAFAPIEPGPASIMRASPAALDCAYGDLIIGQNDRYHELAARLLRHPHVC